MESLLDEWIDGCTDRWVVDGRMDDRINILMVGYMKNVLMDEWMDVGWMDKLIGGWMYS
jgi:hypothetical protein